MTDITPENVARYSPTTAEDWRGMAGGIYAKMRRETNGDYVNFSDYEALAARLAEVEADRAGWIAREAVASSDAVAARRSASNNFAKLTAAEARVTTMTAELAEARTVQAAAGVLLKAWPDDLPLMRAQALYDAMRAEPTMPDAVCLWLETVSGDDMTFRVLAGEQP
jgi:hypothetical protein